MEHSNHRRWSIYPDARQKIIKKITYTLQKHMPPTAPEGMNDLRKIVLRFEEKVYNAAADQQDYLRKITLKMLSLETRTQFPGGNASDSSHKPLHSEWAWIKFKSPIERAHGGRIYLLPSEGAVQQNAVEKDREKKTHTPKGSNSPPSHPTYLQMITEAITSLKERSGSSYYAISHYIDAKYKMQLPANYKKLLTGQLRKLSKSGKLTKIKGSFKVPAQLNKASKHKAPKPVKASPAKKVTSAKPKPKPVTKKVAAKPKAAAQAPAEVVKAPKVPKEKKTLLVAVKKADKPPTKKGKVAA